MSSRRRVNEQRITMARTIYDKPTRALLKDMLKDLGLQPGQVFTTSRQSHATKPAKAAKAVMEAMTPPTQSRPPGKPLCPLEGSSNPPKQEARNARTLRASEAALRNGHDCIPPHTKDGLRQAYAVPSVPIARAGLVRRFQFATRFPHPSMQRAKRCPRHAGSG